MKLGLMRLKKVYSQCHKNVRKYWGPVPIDCLFELLSTSLFLQNLCGPLVNPTLKKKGADSQLIFKQDRRNSSSKFPELKQLVQNMTQKKHEVAHSHTKVISIVASRTDHPPILVQRSSDCPVSLKIVKQILKFIAEN